MFYYENLKLYLFYFKETDQKEKSNFLSFYDFFRPQNDLIERKKIEFLLILALKKERQNTFFSGAGFNHVFKQNSFAHFRIVGKFSELLRQHKGKFWNLGPNKIWHKLPVFSSFKITPLTVEQPPFENNIFYRQVANCFAYPTNIQNFIHLYEKLYPDLNLFRALWNYKQTKKVIQFLKWKSWFRLRPQKRRIWLWYSDILQINIFT